MMKQYILTVCFALCALTLWGQGAPRWVEASDRASAYPDHTFLTGFVSETLRNNDNVDRVKERLKKEAQKELSEGVRLRIEGVTQTGDHSLRVNGKEQIVSSYDAAVKTSSDVEIVGIKTDTYFDSRKNTVYAFAYANKYELKEYYISGVIFSIQKIEGALHSAKQQEVGNNKGRAKKMYEEAKPYFSELEITQSLLIAVGGNEHDAQVAKSLALKSEFAAAMARMQSAVEVYIKSEEQNFDQQVQLLEPKLKAELAKRGCSFTPNRQNADWVLLINASTRKGSDAGGIYFSYLDAQISLIEQRTGKEIYSNVFTDLKGGGLDYKTAGRKAYDNGLKTITEEIVKSIEK